MPQRLDCAAPLVSLTFIPARNCIDTIRSLEIEIDQLRPKAARLKEAEAEHLKARKELHEMMSGMDVEQTGNYGHGSRFEWFISELVRQARSSK